jgi:hypothetical protein
MCRALDCIQLTRRAWWHAQQHTGCILHLCAAALCVLYSTQVALFCLFRRCHALSSRIVACVHALPLAIARMAFSSPSASLTIKPGRIAQQQAANAATCFACRACFICLHLVSATVLPLHGVWQQALDMVPQQNACVMMFCSLYIEQGLCCWLGSSCS